ncbi:MAG: cytochrome P450, partial [Acidobacteriota bacterium]
DHLPELPRPSIPSWRQAWGFLTKPFDLISKARAECGDLFLLDLPGQPMAMVCSADMLREIYKYSEADVVAGEIRGKLLPGIVGDTASISLEGAEFKRRRKAITPYLSGRWVDDLVPTIRHRVEEAIAEWQPEATFAAQPSLDQISRRVTLRILLGELPEDEMARVDRLAHRYLEAFEWRTVQTPPLRRHLGPWSPWTRFQKRRRQLMDEFARQLRARIASDDMGDSLLVGLWNEYHAGLDDDALEILIVDELIAVLVGGSETTSKALGWTLRGLLSTPAAVERLRAEIDAVLGDRGVEYADLSRMPYLDAVVQEGLRHQSVGPFAGPRLTKRDIAVGGYKIPAGTVVAQALHEVGRSDLFPDAETFDPDHFHGRGVQQRDWVPFGGGLRKCGGMGLALNELSTAVVTILQRTELALGPGSTEPVQAGIAHKPKNSLQVRFAGPRACPVVADQSAAEAAGG